jgi:hypothetical protein
MIKYVGSPLYFFYLTSLSSIEAACMFPQLPGQTDPP